MHEQRQLFKKGSQAPGAVSRVEIRSPSPPLPHAAGTQAGMSSTLTCHLPCGVDGDWTLSWPICLGAHGALRVIGVLTKPAQYSRK